MAGTIERLNAGERIKVKMLTSVGGAAMPKYGIHRDFVYQYDQEVMVHADLAAAWVECGQCQPVQAK